MKNVSSSKSPWEIDANQVTEIAPTASNAKFERLAFIVPAIPIAQPRQRHALIAGRIRNFTPTDSPVNAFKATCRQSLASVYSGPPVAGPLRMDLVFVYPRPKSMIWKSRPMLRAWHAIKPDRDNGMKSIQDALEGLVYLNDSQICAGSVEKWIESGDEQPHVEVVFEVLNP